MPRPFTDPVKRFWAKVNKMGPVPKHAPKLGRCWEWTASLFIRGGYGAFGPEPGKIVRAHRYAWQMRRGPVDRKIDVCHKCDNPKCVRLSHLFVGTRMDNVRDQMRKDRYDPNGNRKDWWKKNRRRIQLASRERMSRNRAKIAAGIIRYLKSKGFRLGRWAKYDV